MAAKTFPVNTGSRQKVEKPVRAVGPDEVIYEAVGSKVRRIENGRIRRLGHYLNVRQFHRANFRWGRRQDDPAQLQLAVALLADAVGPKEAGEHYEKMSAVLGMQPGQFSMSQGEIRDHVKSWKPKRRRTRAPARASDPGGVDESEREGDSVPPVASSGGAEDAGDGT